MTDVHGCLQLPNLQTWWVHGQDARSFLHGQLTQDIALMQPAQARWSAYCSPKGRVLTTCLVQDAAPHTASGLWLTLPNDLSESTIQRLRMFVMRADCKFERGNTPNCWGVVGTAIPDELPAQAWSRWVDPQRNITWVRLPHAVVPSKASASPAEAWSEVEMARALCWSFEPNPLSSHQTLQPHVWDWLEIMAAQPWVNLSLRELYTPQMLNLESIDGVSFKKGCYPGQEVVARSQFRGAVKRKMTRIRFRLDTSDCDLKPIPAMPELSDPSTGESLGEVIAWSHHPLESNWVDALVIVPIEWAVNSHPESFVSNIQIKDQRLPVQHLGLPYSIRQDL